MTNEPAERLLHRIDMIGESENIALDLKSYKKDLDAALAIERKAGADEERERIRAALDLNAEIERHGCRDNDMRIPCSFHAHIEAILDAEAQP